MVLWGNFWPGWGQKLIFYDIFVFWKIQGKKLIVFFFTQLTLSFGVLRKPNSKKNPLDFDLTWISLTREKFKKETLWSMFLLLPTL